MTFLRFLVLFATAHRAWPAYPVEKLALAVREAVGASDVAGVPEAVLLAIAQHESDLEPSAISWVENGVRRDRVFTHGGGIALPQGPSTCGYLQARARDAWDCWDAIHGDGGMLRGALEIREWLGTCRGDLRCALAGHAGGNAGAQAHREHRDTMATRFADLFLARARVLGW